MEETMRIRELLLITLAMTAMASASDRRSVGPCGVPDEHLVGNWNDVDPIVVLGDEVELLSNVVDGAVIRRRFSRVFLR
jgi:hypothetical protein